MLSMEFLCKFLQDQRITPERIGMMSGGKDIFGNPAGTDAQGNTDDKNAQGERPKDGHGNPPKDIYGNETGSESDDAA